MLKMRVVKAPCWAEKPWEQIASLPTGTIVEFARTMKPCNIPSESCTQHLDVSKCRNMVVVSQGKEFATNICLEEAKFHFSLVEHDHDTLP